MWFSQSILWFLYVRLLAVLKQIGLVKNLKYLHMFFSKLVMKIRESSSYFSRKHKWAYGEH